jgi:Ca2+-binding RTX toxin-like protein
MADIIGTKGDDTLSGDNGDTLTGGGGNDSYYTNTYTITDFGGIGQGTNPTAEVIAEVDTLIFSSNGLTAQNLLLTQNGNDLEITFENDYGSYYSPTAVTLQNFALSNLDNLSTFTGATVDLTNIVFYDQTSTTDRFDVFNVNSTQSTIFNKNTVTFLNDLNNNVNGFDDSDDVINGQAGDDIIDGKSGNDLLRGGAGNNTLIGGVGNDILNVEFSTGDNTLNGGTGNDTLNAGATSGNNLLSGGDGNDSLYTSYVYTTYPYNVTTSSGNNTLNGGAGNDTLNAESQEGNNFLSGGDGNDFLSTSGFRGYRSYFSFTSSGNNTLDGGTGDDTLLTEYSTGNNLLSGGDGNDYLSASGIVIGGSGGPYYYPSSGNNTLDGGTGNDTLSAGISTGNNLLSGGDGNDSFYLSPTSSNTAPSDLVTQTVDGGEDDDLLSVTYTLATEGITTIFNATTNTGSIAGKTYQVDYKNIERLNISGTDYNDNIVGGSGNDTLFAGYGNDTVDGSNGNDLLSVDYTNATVGITTTFNPTTNTGLITAGTNQVSYTNIEQLNILGTNSDDNIVGNSGNDTLSTGSGGNDTIDGGEGDDVLSVGYSNAAVGITTTFNPTTNSGLITAGNYQVSYQNIERLNILGTYYNDLIVGNSGNDTLSGGIGNDTIIGGAGNDVIAGENDNDTLTGGAGNDKFIYNNYGYDGTDIITDFVGVGKGSNSSEAVIASVDTLQFTGIGSTARNLRLTQDGDNLEITFGDFVSGKVILQNFKLEDLDNLPATSSQPAIGNILFGGETSITDSFDVFDADSTQSTVFNRNTVTFLNDLDNNIIGFDNSNDVINGQAGDDIIDGKSGNDLLRGGAGNNTLNGGTGDDTLSAAGSTGDNLLFGGDGNDSLDVSGNYSTRFDELSDYRSLGNNTLNGDTGNDTLNSSGSTGDNLLFGGDGDDSLNASAGYSQDSSGGSSDYRSLGNNTLNGGTGNDTLSASGSKGDNLLSGDDGNDSLDISGNYYYNYSYDYSDSRPSGTNTLEGGAGDDNLSAGGSTGDNLLSGGDGNDSFNLIINSPDTDLSDLVIQTVDGGNGNDSLSASYYFAAGEITSTFNATTNTGSIRVGMYQVNYNNIERLNISGTSYDDLIVGSNGNDTLIGGNGNDSLYGGNGTDTFGFYNYNGGVDTISDFNATNELIQVDVRFGGLSIGSVSDAQFTIGTSATTSNQRFIYDDSTGGLYFDQDGSAAGSTQVKFAQLSTGLSLTNNNFVVV